MFFFINSLLSVIVWLIITYLFGFSLLGWIIGWVVSFIFYEFIGPILITKIGDRFFR